MAILRTYLNNDDSIKTPIQAVVFGWIGALKARFQGGEAYDFLRVSSAFTRAPRAAFAMPAVLGGIFLVGAMMMVLLCSRPSDECIS